MILYCTKVHVGQQQYKRKEFLCFHNNNDYAKATHCYFMGSVVLRNVVRGGGGFKKIKLGQGEILKGDMRGEAP